MQRRSFIASLFALPVAVKAVAAEAAIAVEPIAAVASTVKACDFAQFLLDEAPRYEAAILRDIATGDHRHSWLDPIPAGKWSQLTD